MVLAWEPPAYKGCGFDFCILPLAVRIGKTLLAKTLARVVNVPFAVADATTLTQASSLLDIVLYLFILVIRLLTICSYAIVWKLPKLWLFEKHGHLQRWVITLLLTKNYTKMSSYGLYFHIQAILHTMKLLAEILMKLCPNIRERFQLLEYMWIFCSIFLMSRMWEI